MIVSVFVTHHRRCCMLERVLYTDGLVVTHDSILVHLVLEVIRDSIDVVCLLA